MLIEDTNGKKAIFGNVDFPHIKSILKKCFKNTSLFFVLAFKILHTEKVTFLKVIKKWFFVSRLLSRGPMALKTCGKDVLENFCFLHKIKILIWSILEFLSRCNSGGVLLRQHGRALWGGKDSWNWVSQHAELRYLFQLKVLLLVPIFS